MKEKLNIFFSNHYKKILVIPALILILSLVYLFMFYQKNGDFINKDVSLTGGTTITFISNVSYSDMESFLSQQFSNYALNSVSDTTGKQTKLIVTVPNEPSELTPKLEQFLGYSLDETNSNVEFTGSNLSADFYNQLIRAIIFAFLLMALVVFLVFGDSKEIKIYSIILTLIGARLTFPISSFIGVLSFLIVLVAFFYGIYLSREKKHLILSSLCLVAFVFLYFFPIYFLVAPLTLLLILIYARFSVPSIAVIAAAFADLVMTLAVVDLLGMKVSSAGIVAFLMLIGYSVDTDVLLTTRVLKRTTDSINKSILGAFKTGITMTLTSIVAVAVALILVYGFNSILNQIFIILIIGLFFDIFNTWFTNACLLKWYAERKLK